LPIFDTCKRIPSILASEKAFIDSQVGCAELILSPGERAAIRSFGVASQWLVVRNGGVVNYWESRILVDIDVVVASASLGFVPWVPLASNRINVAIFNITCAREAAV
jgi:hypothetical protein